MPIDLTARPWAALLFDMDGVLVDSTAHVDRVWRRWARERGIDEQSVLDIAHGRRTVEVLEAVAPRLATAAEVAALERLDQHDDEGVLAIAGALSLVASLPHGCWAVVTSASAALARARLAAAGLPDAPVLVSADDVADGKPHPEGFLRAAALLGARPGHCLVFEDAPPGIAAAAAAGMAVVGVTTTYPAADLSDADVVVGDLEAVHVSIEDGADESPQLHLSINR